MGEVPLSENAPFPGSSGHKCFSFQNLDNNDYANVSENA
jgi:hypothetical protein